MIVNTINYILPILKQFLPLLTAIAVLISGFALFLFPPKKINAFYGYKTPSSMMSQKNWDFSQKYAGKMLIIAGLFLTQVSCVILLLTPEEYIHDPLLSFSMFVSAMIYGIITTELALKKT